MNFVPGWHPDFYAAARDRADAAGVRRFMFSSAAAPKRQAYSLTKYRRRVLIQGNVGTCWEHAATRLAENHLETRGIWFPICRNLVGWAGKKLEDGGNPNDGGTPTDALRAMSDEPSAGYGIAHEDLWQYVDDKWHTGAAPPPNVIADAKPLHMLAATMVTPAVDFNAIAAMIDTDIGVANGQYWWECLDNPSGPIFDRLTRSIHDGFGHALFICGYAQAGVIHAEPCINIDNWHTELYPPLSADKAKAVEGYTPTQSNKTSDYWMTWSVYQQVAQKSGDGMEQVAMTDSNGIAALTLAQAIAL